jgi:hypothetical protein
VEGWRRWQLEDGGATRQHAVRPAAGWGHHCGAEQGRTEEEWRRRKARRRLCWGRKKATCWCVLGHDDVPPRCAAACPHLHGWSIAPHPPPLRVLPELARTLAEIDRQRPTSTRRMGTKAHKHKRTGNTHVSYTY